MCYEIYSISNGVNLVDKVGISLILREAVDFLKEQKFIVGHNLMTYDIPSLKQLYNYEYQGFIADSLAISYYLFPNMAKHGLEAWGKILNVEKLAISDWTGLDLWKYVERCQQDVTVPTRCCKVRLVRHGNQTLYDHKTTTTWVHGKEMKDEWVQQLNLNAYFLEKEGYPVDDVAINAIYVDWRKAK